MKNNNLKTKYFSNFQIYSTLSGLLILIIPLLLTYLAFEFSPSSAAGTKISDKYGDMTTISLFAGVFKFSLSIEVQMLLFVMILSGWGGAIGSIVSDTSISKRGSLHVVIINGLVRTLTASILGVITYVLLRAGVFAPEATARDVNQLGIIVMSLGIGIFAPALLKLLNDLITGLYGAENEVYQAIDRLDQRFESLLAEPILGNFDGTVSVRFLDTENQDLINNEGMPATVTGQECKIEVRFEPGSIERETGFYERIKIENGKESENITFDVALDSKTMEFKEGRSSITFKPIVSSPPLTFNLLAPKKPGSHEVFVEVSQKNQLLQVIPINIIIEKCEP